jgi:hypothetical protein
VKAIADARYRLDHEVLIAPKLAKPLNAAVERIVPDGNAAPTAKRQLIARNGPTNAASETHQHLHDAWL